MNNLHWKIYNWQLRFVGEGDSNCLQKNEKANYSCVVEEKEDKHNELNFCLYTTIKMTSFWRNSDVITAILWLKPWFQSRELCMLR